MPLLVAPPMCRTKKTHKLAPAVIRKRAARSSFPVGTSPFPLPLASYLLQPQRVIVNEQLKHEKVHQ